MPPEVRRGGAARRLFDSVARVFLPLVNTITAVGIIKSALLVLSDAGALDRAGGVYRLFFAASDGFFYFLPFFLAITASREWKTDLFVSLLIPTAMLYPDIAGALENGGSLSFGPLTVSPAVYHSSVLPVLFSVGLLHFVEIPCNRLPDAVRGFLKPIISCLIVIPLAFLVFGPLGTLIGNTLSRVFNSLYSINPVAAGGFLGLVWQAMVIVGAQWSIIPIAINNIAVNGYDIIMPLIAAGALAQGGAAAAVAFMYKRGSPRRRLAFQAGLTGLLGITEPSLFGFNVPLVRPFVTASLAGGLGGVMVGIAGTRCHTFVFPSLVTCLAFTGQGFWTFMFSQVVGYVLAFVATYAQKRAIQPRLEQ